MTWNMLLFEDSVACISRGMEKVKVVIHSLCRTSANTLRFYFGKLRQSKRALYSKQYTVYSYTAIQQTGRDFASAHFALSCHM